MNRFDRIEETAANLRDGILSDIRGHTLLLKLCDLTELLDGMGDSLLLEATLTEFTPYFVRELSKFRVEGNQPGLTKRVITCAEKIRLAIQDETESSILTGSLLRLKKELKLQRLILSGNPRPGQRHSPNFPVIETVEGSYSNCLLDTIRVVLRPGKGEDKFILHPATSKKDPELEDQISTCYRFARRTVETGKSRLSKYFEVQIDLLSGLGAYSGRSFGALLVLLLVIELRKRLHPNRRFGLRADISVTGGIDADGNLLPTGKEAIELKTKAVFFSFSNASILPADDLAYAQKTLSELQSRYPNRKLELIAIKNINDIFNRRDIFRVSRKPVKQRVKEWVRKYRYGALLFLPAIVLLGFFFAREFDTNPVGYELTSNSIIFKNQFGAVLWALNLDSETLQAATVPDPKPRLRVLDLDQDGENEVLISGGLLASNDIDKLRYLYCFNGRKEEIWKFAIQDTVFSFKENKIPPTYEIKIFGSVKIGDRKLLLIWANCVPTYPGAILTIDPATGEKVGNTLWHAGHIISLGLSNTHSDRRPELVVNAIENAYQVSKFYSLSFPFPEAIIHTRPDYLLKNKEVLKPLLEIALPLTDYVKQIKNDPVEYFVPKCLIPEESGEVTMDVHSSYRVADILYKIVFDSRTHDLNYYIDRRFRRTRDSLVNAGKLPLPYTDTKEYTDILKNGVRYKLDGKWVTYQEYVKAGKVKALTPKKK